MQSSRREAELEHYFGLKEYDLRQGKDVPVVWRPEQCINSMALLCGMSGTGKSYQVLRMLSSAARAGLEVDIFDSHEELDKVVGCAKAKYSQATQYGYNPLVLNTDQHSGGVNRQADFVVALIKQVTSQFGSKQEAALRNLIIDLYASRGIFNDNVRTWHRQQMTEQMRETLIEQRNYQQLRNYYPTLSCLLDYANKKVMQLMFGGDNKAMAALETTCRANYALQGLQMKLHRTAAVSSAESDAVAAATKKVEDSSERLIEAFTAAVRAGPAREPKDLLKYDSRDVLLSVLQRLEVLAASGIFSANAPDFGGANVRVHQIKDLGTPQQILFFKLKLRDIFERAKQLGPTASGTELRNIVFLDESPKYFTEDDDDPINVVSREGRKFGVALWCAAQEPTSFPQPFLTNCGAKILLGIDSSFWPGTIKKMRIKPEGLQFIKAKEVIAVKLHRDGYADPPFVNVCVPNPAAEFGRKASAFGRERGWTA